MGEIEAYNDRLGSEINSVYRIWPEIPARCLPESSQAHYTFLSGRGCRVGTMNCMCMGQLLPFVSSKCISLFRSNTMENSMTVIKQSPKSWKAFWQDYYWQWRQIHLQHVCLFQKEQTASPSVTEVSNVIKLSPAGWLVHLGNITILVAQCHFLLLTRWVLTSSYSHIIPSQLKPMLLSPCIISMPPSSATCFLSSFKQWMQWLGKEIPWHAHNGPSCPHDY